jgi:adenylosuccinate lyase
VFAARGSFLASTGGGVGAFAAMAGKGRHVQALVAQRLGLDSNELPVRSAYDVQAAYVCALALMGSTIEKIASEVFTLQRTEIAEVAEGFHRGKVGSSTMAQKRNPVLVMNLEGLARLLRSRVPVMLEAMVRREEGDGASSNVGDVTLPETVICAISLAHGLTRLIEGLAVDRAAMACNLERSSGLIVSEAVMMALAPLIGRHHAHQVLYDVAQDTAEGGGSFATRLRDHPLVQPLLTKLDIDALLDPTFYLGEAPDCVDDELSRSGSGTVSR